MSKDRQQRREQQASVTSGQPARDVTQAPAAGTAKDIPASELPHGFAAIDETTVAARTPAEIIEHAERLQQRAVFAEGEKDMAAAASADRGRSDDCADVEQRMHSAPPKPPFFIRQTSFAGPPRNITINVTANGTEDPEQLSQAILRQVHAQLIMPQDQPAKPPANIPKALHHLRRAIMTVGTLDPTWRIMEDEFSRMVGRGNSVYESSRRTLEGVAAVLELDAHGGAQAAKDVRAAIEALS